LALDRVVAVTRVPDERVVARPEQSRVIAAAAGDDVVAVPAKQLVVAVPTRDGVIPRAAIERELDEARKAVAGDDDVVPAVGVAARIPGGPVIEVERGGAPGLEPPARAVRRNGECLGPIAAVDLRCVVTVAALEKIAVVARIPDHAVVAALTEHLIVAIAAG